VIDTNTMDILREEVKSELLNQEGKYNPNDRDTNVRIVENIRIAIDELADGVTPSAQHIAEVAIATNQNLQIRDFIMGVQLEKDIDYVGKYLELLGNVITKQTAIPLATIFCGYLYQIEEKDYAVKFLDEILEMNPEYPLAKLLYRVFAAEWPTSVFKQMTEQLHQGVLDNIYSIDGEVINNDN